jgi:hypothetical protein
MIADKLGPFQKGELPRTETTRSNVPCNVQTAYVGIMALVELRHLWTSEILISLAKQDR